MASISKTYTPNELNRRGSQLTLTYTGTNQTVGGNFSLTTPTIGFNITGVNSPNYSFNATIQLSAKVGAVTIGTYIYKISISACYSTYRTGTATLQTAPSSTTVDLSQVFNSNNSNIKTSNVTFVVSSLTAHLYDRDRDSGYYEPGSSHTSNYTYDQYSYSNLTYSDAIAVITLNAPPTLTVSDITYDRNYIYKDYTQATVTVSNLSAKYQGTITSCQLQIGSATSSSNTTNGSYSTLLLDAGSLTPKVVVTDSRGQTTTQTLPVITVDSRKLPTITSLLTQRLNNNNVVADEGERVLVIVTPTYDTNVAKMQAPTVTYQREGTSSASTPTIAWYSNRALTTTISNWTTISSGATIYGLITSQCLKDYNYLIVCTPRDNIPSSGTSKSTVVPPAYYTIDFKAGGKGIAFGAPAANDAFYCGMVSHFREDRYIYIDDTTSSSGYDLILKNKFNELGWTSEIQG